MPLGEKMEKPEEDPLYDQQDRNRSKAYYNIPIYLVSPELLVTREHIISERASTSSSPSRRWPSIDLRFSSLSFGGSGEVSELRGVDSAPS